jgi:exonuclease III
MRDGVVTYAKIGTVQSADSTPLNDPELDNQGRCIMTDHGNFVLFNVYVAKCRISLAKNGPKIRSRRPRGITYAYVCLNDCSR